MRDEEKQYIFVWGNNYQKHPLADKVSFVPTKWLLRITSDKKDDLSSNNIHGEILNGKALNKNLCQEGMYHPIIISINGVGDIMKVRLDCGQHRVRIAHHIAKLDVLPCFVEVSHSPSAVIRNLNGDHEYILDPDALKRYPSAITQFEKPDDIFRRFSLSDIK